MYKNINDHQIERAEIKIEQLEAQKQSLLNKQKADARKKRTRRLIEKGALVERYFHSEGTTDELENLLKSLTRLDEVKNIIRQKYC